VTDTRFASNAGKICACEVVDYIRGCGFTACLVNKSAFRSHLKIQASLCSELRQWLPLKNLQTSWKTIRKRL
jgi:hypothetical protein